MSLLQMSFSGAIFIIAVIIIRAVAINKLPKKTFIILWEIILLRLLIPFSIPSVFSIYSFVGQNASALDFSGAQMGNVIPIMSQGQSDQINQTAQLPANDVSVGFVLSFVWCIGMILCAMFFMVSYLRCRMEFQASLPVYNDYVEQWLKEHQLKRPLSIRQSDRISAPLTYGTFRPVILMSKKTDWRNEKQLQYILSHEYVHICHFDTVTKLIAASALCIHWFNPVVWLMYILFNRDIELACDESVIRQFGETSKSAYASMLINMEAKKSGLLPFCNNFSKNSIEERITAIMKTKKVTMRILVISIVVIFFIVVLFATSAKKQEEQMIFYMGKLYVSTQEDVTDAVAWEVEISEYDSPYIGVIETTVNQRQIPNEEMQSNFGYIGSEIVFNGSGVAVNMDGRWIQFESQGNDSFTPSVTMQAVDELIASVTYSNGEVSFTIPDEENIGTWNIWISGRVEIEGFGGMSVHYLMDESESSSWESGRTYSFDVSEGEYTELSMTIQADKAEAAIDIMEFLPQNLQSLGYLEEEEHAIFYTAAFIKDILEDRIVVDIVEFVTDDDVARKKELIEELNLTEGNDLIDGDFLDGYYINNPDNDTVEWMLSNETIYKFVDWECKYTKLDYPDYYSTTDSKIFKEYIGTYDNSEPGMPFFFEVENGVIKSIVEQPIP